MKIVYYGSNDITKKPEFEKGKNTMITDLAFIVRKT